jgi:hypothetical protein
MVDAETHKMFRSGVGMLLYLIQASQLNAAFQHKTSRAKDHAVQCFVAAHGIVHQVHTHQSQESHIAVQSKAKDWIDQIRPRLFGVNCNQRFIINMDQTQFSFLCCQGQH